MMKTIYLAGGCFWGLDAYMSRLYGVIGTLSGYANGRTENPTYEQVCHYNSGHAETVKVDYNPNKTNLSLLLAYYFKVIDPTSINRQGADAGEQYRTGIFYTDSAELEEIQSFISNKQKEYTRPIEVIVEPLKHFYEAEEYHQKYLLKNPKGYCHIPLSLAECIVVDPHLYQKPSTDVLRTKLSSLQFDVTQSAATEKPFANALYDHFEKGIYVDVTTGEPLFTSSDKFESHCGWPSFSKPIVPEVTQNIEDHTHGMTRVEVRSRVGQAHLGHVFNDGPQESGGLRYCINSAALEFISYKEMDQRGYGYLKILVE